MLAFFAVVLFAVMGIAALVVDAGLAFSTQAQLESTGRTLALEYERFRAQQPGVDPAAVEDAWRNGRLPALENALLGVQAPGANWELNGAQVAYDRTVASRFTFGALLPTTPGDGLSVTELLDARDVGGPNAAPSSGGLRATGFQPQLELTLRPEPAARVGVPFSYVDRDGTSRTVPGVASIVLAADAVPAALTAAISNVDTELRVPVPGGGEACVGWTIDAPGASVSIGQGVTPVASASAWTAGFAPQQAYVPVVDGSCGTTNFRVVAFLNLALNGSDGLRPSTVATIRNASAVPFDRTQPIPVAPPMWSCGSPAALLCVRSLAAGAP